MSTTEDRLAESGQEQAVIYEVTRSGVAVLTLNRPDRLNTWGGDIATAFYAGIERAEEDPAVRVIVLTGRGKAFCAGAQLGSMGSVTESIDKTDAGKLASLIGDRQPYHLTTLCKPVVAAINGSCVGIGLTQALMCDVRFAAAVFLRLPVWPLGAPPSHVTVPASYCNTYRRVFDTYRGARRVPDQRPLTGVRGEISSATALLRMLDNLRVPRAEGDGAGGPDSSQCSAQSGILAVRAISKRRYRLLQNALPIGIQYAYTL
jgi:hypothetical protein